MTTQPNPPERPTQGLRSVTGDEFHVLESVGGVRGLVEATAPGLIYLVVYVTTTQLTPALISSLGVAAVLVVLRLLQRTPVTMAFSGIFGVAIGLFIAWKSGDASDFYVWGLLVNLAYILALGVSLAVRWPGVGIMVELLKAGLGTTPLKKPSAESDSDEQTGNVPVTSGALVNQEDGVEKNSEEPEQEFSLGALFPRAWRRDPVWLKKYTVATWLWVVMFGLRLGIQGPLYLGGTDYIAALGSARLIMGLPLFALVLWLTWRIVRQPEPAANQ